METATSHSSRLIVAAFDIGTAFSGYAFSLKDSLLDIKTNQAWSVGSQQLISLKTSTCVLLKPNQEFHSFGFEAENHYSELAEDDKHQGWFLFRRFKMALYQTKDLKKDTEIEDISGNKMPALTIFGHCIRYLNQHLLKTLEDQTVGITAKDIQYVLTVPAIWDEKAKQFMRQAANEGGINDNQLMIALEPEAASIWCQVATDHKLSGLAASGFKYMVVDLGGGTADITMHEKMKDGSLKEIHKASGGAWGGVEVDKAYIQMLTNVLGEAVVEKFRENHVGDYFDLLRDFETKKRTITNETEGKMTFKIPSSLKDCAEFEGCSIKDVIEKSPYKGKMIWAGDKIRIEKCIARGLFDGTIDALTKYVGELLSKPHFSMINVILLVGGFGECALVKEAFRGKFGNKKVMIPKESGLAVLKGAVRFGHFPDIVSVRIARYTYGRAGCATFVEGLHDPEKKFTHSGNAICQWVFKKFVTIGEEIPLGKEVVQESCAVFANQKSATLELYSVCLQILNTLQTMTAHC